MGVNNIWHSIVVNNLCYNKSIEIQIQGIEGLTSIKTQQQT